MHSEVDFIRARELWLLEIAKSPTYPELLHNAARFFESTDPQVSDRLAELLRNVDPVGHGKLVDYYFARVAPGFRRYGAERTDSEQRN